MKLRLILRLARRFRRATSQVRLVFVVVAVSAAVGFGMYVVLLSQSLSGAQVADRDLGRFDYVMGVNVGAYPPGNAIGDNLAAASTYGWGPGTTPGSPASGTSAVAAGLIVTDFNLPVLGSSVPYKEFEWAQTPFPDRYNLIEGNWPRHAGEIALVNAMTSGATSLGSTLRIGPAQVTVVGRAEDRMESSRGILGAPGTWAGLPSELGSLNPAMTASALLFWSDSAGMDSTTAIAIYERGGVTGGPAQRALRSSVRTRVDALQTSEKSWIAGSPAGYQLLILFLPALSVLGAFALAAHRLRPSLRSLRSLGIDRNVAVLAVWLALARAAGVAAVVGAVGGYLLGAGASWLLDLYSRAPAFAWHAPVAPALGFVASGAVGSALGLLPLRRAAEFRASRHAKSAPTESVDSLGEARNGRGARVLASARRLASLACICAGLVEIARLNDAADAMILGGVFGGACLLVMPDAVPAIVSRVPSTRPQARLALRQLAADSPRTVTSACLLAIVVGVAGGFFVLFDTMIATADDRAYPDVAPGQVLLMDRDTIVAPVPDEVVRAVSSVRELSADQPIELHFLLHDAGRGDYQPITATGARGLIFAVASAENAAALIGHPLEEAQLAALRRGELLTWDPAVAEEDRMVNLHSPEGDTVGAIAVSSVTVDQTALNLGTTGVLLTSTARRLGLPMIRGATLYAGVSPSAAADLAAAVASAGIDPHMVQIYHDPGPPIPPLALYVTAVGLSAVVLLSTVAVTLGTAGALRTQGAHLLAIGLNRRWARGVVARQHLVVSGIGMGFGLLMSLVPALAAVALIPNYTLRIPWTQLGVLVIAVLTASGLALFASGRRAVAATRFEGGDVLG